MHIKPTADTRLTISAVGTCRLDAPLRAGAQRRGYHWVNKRVYGYAHAISEVVQQVRFLNGDYKPDPALWEVIAKHDLTHISKEKFTPSDINLVEISSRKQLSIDGHAVQINHLKSACAPFFDDIGHKTRFWNALRANDRVEQKAMIDAFAVRVGLTSDQQHLLNRLQLSETSDPELRAGLNYVRETLIDPIIMTHVDALKGDGRRIPSRSACVEQVERVASEIGLTVFNPTKVMHEIGQSRAIEDESESLAHFTDFFSCHLFDTWHSELLAGRVDQMMKAARAESDIRKYDVHIRACLAVDGIEECNRRVDQLISKPASLDKELRKLSMRLNASANDISRTQAVAAQIVLDGEIDRNLFVHAAQHALRNTDTYLLRHCIKMACQASIIEDNLYWAPALRALVAMDADVGIETSVDLFTSYPNIRTEILRIICDLLVSDPKLAKDARFRQMLCQLNSKDFDAALMAQLIVSMDEDQVGFLFELITQSSDRFLQAYGVLARHDAVKASQRANAILLVLEAERCGGETAIHSLVQEAENEDDLTRRVELLSEALSWDVSNKGARRLMRGLQKSTLAAAKKAHLIRDSATLRSLLDVATQIIPPIDHVPYFLGRLCYAEGNGEAALRHARRATDLAPDVARNWVLVLRSAVMLRSFELAETAAQKVLQTASTDETKAIDEAKRRLGWAQKKLLNRAVVGADCVDALHLLQRIRANPDLTAKATIEIQQVIKILAGNLKHFIQDGHIHDAWSLIREIAPVCANDPNCREIVVNVLENADCFGMASPFIRNLTSGHTDCFDNQD